VKFDISRMAKVGTGSSSSYITTTISPFQVEQSKKGDYGALGDLRVGKGKIDLPHTTL